MSKPQYRSAHQRARARLLESNPMCAYDCGRLATVADHVPPLALFSNPLDWHGTLVPSCAKCSASQGGHLRGVRARQGRRTLPAPSRQW